MFDNVNLGPEILRNPGKIQDLVIQATAQRIAADIGDDVTLPDPNSAVNVLWDFGSSLTAQMVRQEDDKISSIFRQRVRTSEDVYSFLSDYDYTKITASPASLNVRLVLSRQWLIQNAVSFDDNYNKIQIPSTAKFVLGQWTFGLYYPIDILVSKSTGGITVTYNTDTLNPLHALESNELTDVSQFTSSGIDMISLVFPIYQFERTTDTIYTTSTIGVVKTYTYTDQFYAVKIQALVNGQWKELDYTLSSFAYDPLSPTALLTVMSDTKSLKIEIPQVYYTRGLMGTQIKVDIYTTNGALNATIPDTDAQDMQVDFDQSANTYSGPWTPVPVIGILPFNTTILEGGSDAMTFDELRTIVANDRLYADAIVTRLDMIEATTKLGFSLTKYVDNLNRRVYFADAKLVAPDGYVVPCAYSGTILDKDALSGDPSTIIKHSDLTYTVLPTTLFNYDTGSNTAKVLKDADVAGLKALSVSDLADRLNSSCITRQPFHIVLNTALKYPAAKAYNLMSPTMTTLNFVKENAHIASQYSITQVYVTHLKEGAGGFSIVLGASRTPGMESVDPSTLSIVLMTTLRSGARATLLASYVSTTSNGLDVFRAILSTDYHLSDDGYFTVTAGTSEDNQITNDIPLAATFDVRMLIPQSLEPTVEQDLSLSADIPSALLDGNLVACQQSVGIQFGEDISTIVFNPINVTWGATEYKTYPSDVDDTWETDLFRTDSTGNVEVYQTDTGVYLNPIFVVDDPKFYTGGYFFTTTALTPNGGLVSTGTLTTINDHPSANPKLTDLLLGAQVTYNGITTSIKAIDPVAGTITLADPTTALLPVGTSFTIQPMCLSDSSAYALAQDVSDATSLTFTSDLAKTICIGMVIRTFGYSGTVSAVNTTTGVITVVPDATNSLLPKAGMVCTFFNPKGTRLLRYKAGATVLNTQTLEPQVVDADSRSNIYAVTMVHFDYKLFASQSDSDVTFAQSLPNILSTKAHTLDKVRDSFIENFELYFRPLRTFGTTTFDVGDGDTKILNLAQSFTVTYYVTDTVKKNTDVTDLITSSTATIVGNYLTQDDISSDELSALLKTTFASQVTAVSVSGIDEIADLRVASVLESGVSPSLGRKLTVLANNTLTTVPDITVIFKIKATAVSAL